MYIEVPMSCRLILRLSSQWTLKRVPHPVLRPHFSYTMLSVCLRVPMGLSAVPSRSCVSTVHFRRSIKMLSRLSGGRTIKISYHFLRQYWKQCVTAGTLCGSGVLVGRMAVTNTNDASHIHKYQSSIASDSITHHIADQSTYCEATFNRFTQLEKVYVVMRFVYLSFLFCPALLLYSIGWLFRSTRIESLAWSYTMRATQTAGPAFIKLGQWASTRRDLFSEEFCNSLSQLHSSCQSHRWKDTERTLQEEFGQEWGEFLEITNQEPIGSGCVAQVYKGYLKTAAYNIVRGSEEESHSNETQKSSIIQSIFSVFTRTWWTKSREKEERTDKDDGPTAVAVKVLHPGTVQAMERDMLLMRYGAYWMDWLNPDYHWVALKECFSEFASVMRKQLDMELEAHNLRRFQQNMGDNYCVKFPTPLFPFVTKRVLVETFEPGSHISNYMDNPGGKLQKALARIGTNALLDMLFIHNFVHGDLHPGNILVQDTQEPRLVLLDCGIATSLTPIDLLQMQRLFTAIIQRDGVNVANLIMGSQPCPTVDEYRSNMAELISRGVDALTEIKNTKVSSLFSDLFNVLMKHKVRIEPNYTSVVMAITVIEGLGRSLDPSLNLLEAVTPCLLHRARRDLTAKIIGS